MTRGEGRAVTGWERLATFEGGTVSWLATATAADGSRHAFAATPVGVFRSTDLGLRWSPLGEPSRVAGVEVVAASPSYAEDGIVFAGAYDGLFRWREGGTEWEHLLSGSKVMSVACASPDPVDDSSSDGPIVLVGTAEDGILISRDGGRTWDGANAGLLDLAVFELAMSPDFSQDGIAFAATSSGLYRTRNGAESWREVDVGLDDGVVTSVAVSPTFPEDRLVIAISFDFGLLRSTDAGRSWEDLSETHGWMASHASCWSGGRIGAATEIGVGLSDDGGQTWRLDWRHREMRKVRSSHHVVLLEGDPEGSSGILLVGTRFGIVRSDDWGRTWSSANSGLAAALITDLVLSPAFEHDQTLYLVAPLVGPMLSTDGGRTWAAPLDPVDRASLSAPTDILDPDNPYLDDEPEENAARNAYHMPSLLAAARSPNGDQLIYGGTYRGLHLSRDDGQTWERLNLDAMYGPERRDLLVEVVETISVAETSSGVCILVLIETGRGMAGLLGASDDGGATWYAVATPSEQTFTRAVVLSPEYRSDGTIYVATHPAALRTEAKELSLWRTTDRGKRWDRWLEVPDVAGGTAIRVVPLPENRWGDTVVLGYGGQVLRPRQNAWENKGGARRPVWDAVELPGQDAAGRLPAIAGLVASPSYAEDRTLFAATSAGVYVSRDGGATFAAWNDGLESLATVAVAPSPAYARDRLVFALGLGGTIWRRLDD